MIKLLPATKRSIRCLTTTSSTHELLDKWNCLISTVTIEPTSTGPLSGTKYILKDNIVTKNSTSTAASKTLSNYKSPSMPLLLTYSHLKDQHLLVNQTWMNLEWVQQI